MDRKKLGRLSHRMSAVLRHRALAVGLEMDAAGWTSIASLCASVRASRQQVEAVVRENNKARFQLDGDRIRACQGHSLAGMPVTQEALEASWEPFDSERTIWHGTRVEVIEAIAAEGITRGGRTHVHLAAAVDSRVGKRANVAVLLAVSPRVLRVDGGPIFRSQNGVVLTRWVPPACIVGIECTTRRSRERAGELRGLLGVG